MLVTVELNIYATWHSRFSTAASQCKNFYKGTRKRAPAFSPTSRICPAHLVAKMRNTARIYFSSSRSEQVLALNFSR